MTVDARMEGRCGICDGPINVGDPIEMVDGEWCHEDCAAEVDDAGT